MDMRCRDCKRPVPEVPYLHFRGRGPLCWADFRRRRRLNRRSGVWSFLAKLGVV